MKQDTENAPSRAEAKQTVPTEAGRQDEPMLYCPVCDQHLTESKCKLICDRCGYFMSCADYY